MPVDVSGGSTTDALSSTRDAALAGTLASGAGAGTRGRAPSLERGAQVGRYVVLSRLGAGGMGEVFAVYDPELDRKVALKLLHPRLAADADALAVREAGARLVREAQALARLNHPNIVAVHDVGEHAGAVWLAMEYVDGETLSTWLKTRRSWREVLEVMTAAGRGLAAAHAAGLVHRDIKPDNLMIGRDGRVRVMDLGLARAAGGDGPAAETPDDGRTREARAGVALAVQMTRAGAVLGTPAYMSPEQFHGAPVDARADVFSYCVTLWEALMGERPFGGDTLAELAASVIAGKVRPAPRGAADVPAWLRRVCLRGLASEPGQRFASMDALLKALARGQAQARVGAWLVGATAVLAIGTSVGVARHLERVGRIEACEQAGADIAEVWNDETRARVREGIVATGLSYAPVTAEKLLPILDGQAAAWREHRTRACLAGEVEATLGAEPLDKALWCLDERRMELAALLTALSHADASAVQRAVTAAAELAPVTSCTDAQVLAALPSPPPLAARGQADAARAKLSEGRALLAAGRYTAALERAREAIAAAEAVDWPPLTAAARLLEGYCLEKTSAFAEAEAASIAAYMQAAKARAWDIADSAALELAFVVGEKQTRYAEGEVWAGHAAVANSLAGDPLGLREALRLNQLGLVATSRGAYEEAKALHERALGLREQALGPEHGLVAASLNNLARVHGGMGAYAEARALRERALALREQTLGPDHPLVATTLSNLASDCMNMGDHAGAKARLERALAVQEVALGRDHADVATTLSNLANVYYVMGRYTEAGALAERALAIREKVLGPDHFQVAASLNTLALVRSMAGAPDEARALYERTLAIMEKVLGRDHPDVAVLLNNLAGLYGATGAEAEAEATYTRALAIQEKALGRDHPSVATTLSNLASFRFDAGRYAEAKALYEQALAIQEVALGRDHAGLAGTLTGLARVLLQTGARPEARARFERALAIREKALGREHVEVALTLGYLGGLALDEDRPAEALLSLERAVGIFEAHAGTQGNEPGTRLDLARALVRTGGDRDRALAEARTAAAMFREGGAPQAKLLAAAEAFLAKHAP